MRAQVCLALILAGCTGEAGPSPELACQQRIAEVWDRAGAETADPFNSRAYAAVDRAGCTPVQVAALDRFVALTAALPALSEANEAAAKSGGADHMAAFQRMNDAVIELNEMHRTEQAELARLSPPSGR